MSDSGSSSASSSSGPHAVERGSDNENDAEDADGNSDDSSSDVVVDVGEVEQPVELLSGSSDEDSDSPRLVEESQTSPRGVEKNVSASSSAKTSKDQLREIEKSPRDAWSCPDTHSHSGSSKRPELKTGGSSTGDVEPELGSPKIVISPTSRTNSKRSWNDSEKTASTPKRFKELSQDPPSPDRSHTSGDDDQSTGRNPPVKRASITSFSVSAVSVSVRPNLAESPQLLLSGDVNAPSEKASFRRVPSGKPLVGTGASQFGLYREGSEPLSSPSPAGRKEQMGQKTPSQTRTATSSIASVSDSSSTPGRAVPFETCIPVTPSRDRRPTRTALPPPKRTSSRGSRRRTEQSSYAKSTTASRQRGSSPPSPKQPKKTKAEVDALREKAERAKEKTKALYQSEIDRLHKRVQAWKAAVVPGAEARMLRACRPLRVLVTERWSGSRFEDGVTLKEGETGVVLAAVGERKDGFGVVENNAAMLIVDRDEEQNVKNIVVWLAMRRLDVLVRVAAITITRAPVDAELRKGAVLGPVLLGRQPALRAMDNRRAVQVKARPTWSVKKSAKAPQVEQVETDFPRGCFVVLADESEGMVKGYRDGKVLVQIEGGRGKLVEPEGLSLAKKKIYALSTMNGPQFASGQLDSRNADREAKKRLTLAEGEEQKKKEKVEEESLLAPPKKMSPTKLGDVVKRLQGYSSEHPTTSCGAIKCQSREFVEEKLREQDELIELNKRRANPTYDDLQRWKAMWSSRTHNLTAPP
ncbi:hypothetical protein DIPPA_10174 [Diplonema papillatum]|nr:hypothetical protein DIPPA_10174 [Diplonema papillatum]